MQRKITCFSTLFLSLFFSAICLFACGKGGGETKATLVEETENIVAIRVDEVEKDTTSYVYNAMTYLEEKGELSFVIDEGMVISINGKENDGWNAGWILYASDIAEGYVYTDYPYEYNGQALYSCAFGAERMPVKAGCLYVWVYTVF